MSTLKIEMVHDIVCSWCPIGYNNIQTALKNLKLEVDFRFLPFELNPQMPAEGEDIAAYFKRRSDWDEQRLLAYQNSLIETARKAGVTIDFSKRTKYYNTHKAHRLMHLAHEYEQQTALNELLITAYFTEGKDIGDTAVLFELSAQLGFDKVRVEEALFSVEVRQKIQHKKYRQQEFNIQSIPAFIVNEDTLISGSQSVAFFEEALPKFIKKPAA